MTVAVTEWLPDGSIFDGRIEQAVSDAAGGWAEKWFAEPVNLRVSVEDAHNGPASIPADRIWQSADETLCFAFAGEECARLARRALRYTGQFQEKKAEDQRLMTSLSEAVLEDLSKRLAVLFPGAGIPVTEEKISPLAEPQPSWSGLSFSLTLFDDDVCLVFLCSRARACRARKALLTAPAARRLEPLQRALDRQDVGISGYAGQTRLTLTEFREMEPGDVLTLDRTLSDGIPLSLNRRAVLPLKGDVEIDGPAANLRIRGTL